MEITLHLVLRRIWRIKPLGIIHVVLVVTFVTIHIYISAANPLLLWIKQASETEMMR